MKHKFKRLLMAVVLSCVTAVAMAATITVRTDNGDGTTTVAVYQVNADGSRTLISVCIVRNDKRQID